MWQPKPLNGFDLLRTAVFTGANYLNQNVPVMSQYRNLFGGAGWRAIIILRRLRNQSLCDCGAAHVAWVRCLNLPMNRIISTRNTKVEMARPEVCQNLKIAEHPHAWHAAPSNQPPGERLSGRCADQIRRNISPDTPAFLDSLGSADENVSIDTLSVA